MIAQELANQSRQRMACAALPCLPRSSASKYRCGPIAVSGKFAVHGSAMRDTAVCRKSIARVVSAARSAKRARREARSVSGPGSAVLPRGACSICRSRPVTSAESPAKVARSTNASKLSRTSSQYGRRKSGDRLASTWRLAQSYIRFARSAVGKPASAAWTIQASNGSSPATAFHALTASIERPCAAKATRRY